MKWKLQTNNQSLNTTAVKLPDKTKCSESKNCYCSVCWCRGSDQHLMWILGTGYSLTRIFLHLESIINKYKKRISCCDICVRGQLQTWQIRLRFCVCEMQYYIKDLQRSYYNGKYGSGWIHRPVVATFKDAEKWSMWKAIRWLWPRIRRFWTRSDINLSLYYEWVKTCSTVILA